MPIAKRPVNEDKAPDLGPVKTTAREQYVDGITEDGVSTLSMHSLFPEGIKLVVDYYSAIRSDTMAVEPYSIDISPTLQTYTHIKNLELRADGDFSYNQIKSDMQSTLTGSALIAGGSIVPQRHDFFIVNVSSNRKAIFNIVDVSKPSIHDTTSYTIEYESSYQLDDLIVSDLTLKATHQYIYDRTLLYQNKNALISAGDVVSKEKLVSISKETFNRYVNDFYDKRASTFIFNNGVIKFFDPYLVKFLQSIVNVERVTPLRNMRTYNICEYAEYDIGTFWDKLLTSSTYYSDIPLKIVDVSTLTNIYYTGNLRYTDINYFIVPSTNDTLIDIDVSPAITIDDNLIFPQLDMSLGYVFLPGIATRDNLSVFEDCVIKVFNNEPVNLETVMDLYMKVDTLDKLQRFYYIPILMVMLLSGGI